VDDKTLLRLRQTEVFQRPKDNRLDKQEIWLQVGFIVDK